MVTLFYGQNLEVYQTCQTLPHLESKIILGGLRLTCAMLGVQI